MLNGFNYAEGQNTGVELKAVYTNGNLRAYANWAWAIQRATNIVSNQYLFGAAEIAYIQNNWIYTDHSQMWTGSGGISYLWNGTRFTTDVIYGSGLRAGDFNTDHSLPMRRSMPACRMNSIIPGWNPITARFDVVNVIDTSYVIRNRRRHRRVRSAIRPSPRLLFRAGAEVRAGRQQAAACAAGLCAGLSPGLCAAADFKGCNRKRCGPGPASTWAATSAAAPASSTPIRSTATISAIRCSQPAPRSSTTAALGGGQVGYNWQAGMCRGRPRDRRRVRSPAHDRRACLPGRDLQSGHHLTASMRRWPWSISTIWTGSGRCAGASAWRYAGHAALRHRRACIRRGRAQSAPFTAPASTINGNIVPAANIFISRSLREGWTAGGGLEAHLGGNWTGKVEYLHVDLGHDRRRASLPANSTPIAIAFNSHITEDMVRVGLNYKFDPYVAYVPVYPTPPAPVLERVRPVYKAPMQALWTWTGFYFGANAGYATGSFDTSTLYSDAWMGTPLFGAQSSARLKGGIGGAQTGYNLQSGIWFAGLETDIQFSTQRNITTSLCPGAVCNPAASPSTHR